MKESDAVLLGKVFGVLFAVLLTGGLFALFTNWIVSMIADWPVTWSNWGITWGIIFILSVIFKNKSK